MRKEALSLDLDGPTIWRIINFQQKATKEYRRHGPGMYTPPERIPHIPRLISQEPLTPGELLSFWAHYIRFVYPGAAQALLDNNHLDIYGNTGRSNKKAWVDMTQGTLKRAGVDFPIREIFFRPKSVPTWMSKLAGVADLRDKYARVKHVDDNPADGLPIAIRFPDVSVRLVKDLSTGYLLSGVDLSKLPNVKVVPSLAAALQE